MSSEKKKLKAGQIIWLGVVGVGNLLMLISIVSSLLKVSVPHPSDTVQTYDCGSVVSPLSSLSDSKYSTDIVCREVMRGRRTSVFWLEVFGWILSVGGVVMFVRSLVRVKPVESKNTHE